MLDLYLSKYSSLYHINRESLAKKSNGLTGADINNLTNEVLLECRTRNVKPTIDDKMVIFLLLDDLLSTNNTSFFAYQNR